MKSITVETGCAGGVQVAHADTCIATTAIGSTERGWRSCLLAALLSSCILVVACGGGGEPITVAPQEPPIVETSLTGKERSGEVSYLMSQDADGFQFGVVGVDLEQVIALHFNGVDVLPAMKAAASSGLGEIQLLEDGGFYFIGSTLPGIQSEGSFSIATAAGWSTPTVVGYDTTTESVGADASAQPERASMAVLSSKATCPWLKFRAPTAVPPNKSCGYGSTNCADKGKAHTGIDYSGTGTAVATADGVVVWKETMNSKDHGMGTNVIIRHRLSSCGDIYSSYSHLASIDKRVRVGDSVSAGQTIGSIGASGYGQPSYWGKTPHLHFELKASAVTGNPKGVGNKRGTCKSDAKNAGPSTCWGYVDAKLGPAAFGYQNPGDFLGK